MAISFERAALPYFVLWKMGPSGTYVVGLEPANALVEGLAVERTKGRLQYLEPGESRRYRLREARSGVWAMLVVAAASHNEELPDVVGDQARSDRPRRSRLGSDSPIAARQRVGEPAAGDRIRIPNWTAAWSVRPSAPLSAGRPLRLLDRNRTDELSARR